MAMIKYLGKHKPQIGKNTWLAETATVIGEVEIGKDCGVWYGAVLRGDVGLIKIGNRTNIQDNAVLHGTDKKSLTVVGNNVTIGHRAIVHGCKIGNNVLIGMGAIVLDNAVIEDNSIVAAGAVVLEKTVIKSGTIYAGVPAKEVKKLYISEVREMNQMSASHYVLKKEEHR
ncbi:MAG: gamma carbonic anhydrase family protein [Flavobacteriales bacterium]|nr:gamma carbonic anhydrase family protein [Flavobacteriales bacterium]